MLQAISNIVTLTVWGALGIVALVAVAVQPAALLGVAAYGCLTPAVLHEVK